MKTYYNKDDFLVTSFSNEEEKETIFGLIKNHIDLMPKVYRKYYVNWVIVQNLTKHGSGYSSSICRALGVDPYGYKWEELKNE